MPVVKKRNEQTETRLLLESEDPVELPPAEIDDKAVLVQFDKFKPYLPELLETLRAVYDDTGGIGKLYARQDEIGTPSCVTVDHQSLEDEAVTVRDRDTWEQERVKISDLTQHLVDRLKG